MIVSYFFSNRSISVLPTKQTNIATYKYNKVVVTKVSSLKMNHNALNYCLNGVNNNLISFKGDCVPTSIRCGNSALLQTCWLDKFSSRDLSRCVLCVSPHPRKLQFKYTSHHHLLRLTINIDGKKQDIFELSAADPLILSVQNTSPRKKAIF